MNTEDKLNMLQTVIEDVTGEWIPREDLNLVVEKLAELDVLIITKSDLDEAINDFHRDNQ